MFLIGHLYCITGNILLSLVHSNLPLRFGHAIRS